MVRISVRNVNLRLERPNVEVTGAARLLTSTQN